MIRVVIVGAGLGGLTLALALARAGGEPVVREQAPALAPVGAGITLGPNAVKILDHLGLGDRLREEGFSPGRQWTQHWQSGAVIRESERGPELARTYGAAYLHLHRADLHAMLVEALEAAAPGALELDQRVVAVSPDARATFETGGEIGGDVLVGADGLKSVVRESLFGNASPAFTGQVAWRGIVPAERLPERVRALPPGIHVGPGRLFMRYPVRRGALLNYAAFVELEGWTEESWTRRSTVAELLGHFEGWDPAVRAMIEATPADELYKWALFTREPLPTWISGRATLLGDAAHAMLPFMGQGAATAIEDGMVLGRCLAGFPPDEALRRYEAARRDRTTMVQTQSRLLGLRFQGKDPDSLGRGAIKNEETLGLFGYDAVTASL